MSEVETEVKTLEQAYSTCFKTKEGQLVLADLQRRYGINKTIMDSNPHFTSYNEGMRSVVLYIQDMTQMRIKKEELKNEKGQP